MLPQPSIKASLGIKKPPHLFTNGEVSYEHLKLMRFRPAWRASVLPGLCYRLLLYGYRAQCSDRKAE